MGFSILSQEASALVILVVSGSLGLFLHLFPFIGPSGATDGVRNCCVVLICLPSLWSSFIDPFGWCLPSSKQNGIDSLFSLLGTSKC